MMRLFELSLPPIYICVGTYERQMIRASRCVALGVDLVDLQVQEGPDDRTSCCWHGYQDCSTWLVGVTATNDRMPRDSGQPAVCRTGSDWGYLFFRQNDVPSSC